MRIKLQAMANSNGMLGVCSVPVLPGLSTLKNLDAGPDQVQWVPVGYWPDGYCDRPQFTEVWRRQGWSPPPRRPAGERWPRRMLSFFAFSGTPPRSFDLTALPSSRGVVRSSPVVDVSGGSGWSVRVHQKPEILSSNHEQGLYHYCADRDGAVELGYGDQTLTLRSGWRAPAMAGRCSGNGSMRSDYGAGRSSRGGSSAATSMRGRPIAA